MARETKEPKCPFYKDETSLSIRCEGNVSYACANNFRGQKQKREYKEKFCNTDYEGCEHYKQVLKKYF